MKVSPSEQKLKEDKIILEKANKAYAKQQKLNKKNWKQTRQVSMKKKYHHLKKVKKPKSMGWKF